MASQVIHWLNAVDWDFTPLQRQAAIWLFNTLEITFLLHWDELIMGCRTGTRFFADTFLLIAIEEMRQSNGLGENSLNVESEQWVLPAFNSIDSPGSFHLSILQPLETKTTMG